KRPPYRRNTQRPSCGCRLSTRRTWLMARICAMQRCPASRAKSTNVLTIPKCRTWTSTSSSLTTKYMSLACIRTACSTSTATTCSGSSRRKCKGTVSSQGLSNCSFEISVLVSIGLVVSSREFNGFAFISNDVQDEVHAHDLQELLRRRRRRMQDQHSTFPMKPLVSC